MLVEENESKDNRNQGKEVGKEQYRVVKIQKKGQTMGQDRQGGKEGEDKEAEQENEKRKEAVGTMAGQ